MPYIDMNMIPVPTADKDGYVKMVKDFAEWAKGEGALQVVDCWGDDLPVGETNCMNSAVLKKDGESVGMGWIVWPDKATRDAAWEKMMSPDSGIDMEFVGDGKRMIFGGYEVLNQS